MPKRDLHLLMLQELNLDTLPLKLLPISTEHGERARRERSTNDQAVRGWFQKIRSGDESLDDEEGRGQACSL